MSGNSPAPQPGQAAYEAFYPASDRATEIVPWDRLTNRAREPWEAAAQAVAPALAGLLATARQLRDETFDERDRLTERVAGLVTEGNELRVLLGEILADCPGCGYWHGPPTGRDQVARWRERAGLTSMPAVVTAGTGHLAEQIRDLAIPDEL